MDEPRVDDESRPDETLDAGDRLDADGKSDADHKSDADGKLDVDETLDADEKLETDDESTGFAFTRRRMLQAAGAVSAATAGCNTSSDSTDSPTDSPTATRAESVGTITEPGLKRVRTELVAGREGADKYLRVTVQNTRDEPMSFVSLSAEFFDPDLQFLEVQLASITHLRPGEMFDGYIPYWSDNVAAYSVRTDWSSRDGRQQELPDVSVADTCIAGSEVSGTVSNDTGTTLSRVRVEVTFQNENGETLEQQTDTLTGLEAGESAAFAVESDVVYEHSTTSIADYTVTVGEYGGDLLAVR